MAVTPPHDQPAPRAAAVRAQVFQRVFPLLRALLLASPRLQFTTKPIAAPTTLDVPTRHGRVRTLVYAPTEDDIAAQRAAGQRPPVHLITHGGAFILRSPKQEDNVARYLASEVGCYVLVPDFDSAPQVRFPVQEEECYDVFRWIHEQATEHRWDGDRISVGGASSGGKLALNVALMAIDDGYRRPVAVSSEFGVADVSLPDSARTSSKARPVVGPGLMTLVRQTYFYGVDLQSPLASPALHPRRAELPPTLIETAEFDTLKHESNSLALDLIALGVAVTHREFPGVDHGFTHVKPVETARTAIALLGRHLASAYAGAVQTG